MKIKSYEIFECDAGWRTFSFLKLVADSGVVGWSEFNESFGSPGLGATIRALMPNVVGLDPMQIEWINAVLNSKSVPSRGGIARQAIGAIENALLDVKARALGVPVYQLFGGKVRDRLPVYWSHCATYRLDKHQHCGTPQIKTYDDIVAMGREVRERGFMALKTNVVIPVEDGMRLHRPGFAVGRGFPERNWDKFVIDAARKTVASFREGCGPEVEILMDLNFNFRAEGFRKVGQALADANLAWLEVDIHDADTLADVRRGIDCPLASGETLLERKDFKPYFEARAMDVAIIDAIWNGVAESHKIAAMADAYDINVAPHNFYGHLASAINAQFCAALPNFRIMETDIDSVAWRDEFVHAPPVIEDGEYVLGDGPGWGIEVNEAAVRARARPS